MMLDVECQVNMTSLRLAFMFVSYMYDTVYYWSIYHLVIIDQTL